MEDPLLSAGVITVILTLAIVAVVAAVVLGLRRKTGPELEVRRIA